MICQGCGLEAPTKYVEFYQNIGALFVRFPRSAKGNLCKSCIHRFFWKYTSTTFFLGWWGTISFCVTPFYVLNNTFRYLASLGMQPVPPDASKPELTQDAVEKLEPYADDLIMRLNEGEPLAKVTEEVGERAGVTPGQVQLYLSALTRAARKKRSSRDR